MRTEEKLYTVYRLENVVTKKNYIGMTSRNPKRKMAEAKSGRVLTEEHRKKISEAMTGEKHPNFGKHPTEEIRKKMSENRPSKSVLQFSKSGELIAEYPSGKEAQKQTGLPTSNICSCCKGRQKSCGGYIWRYK